MTSNSKGADKAVDPSILNAFQAALVDGALPGEVSGLDGEAVEDAAAFVAAAASRRPPGAALVNLESLGGEVGQRRMRIVIVNDDMPFLVDSVAAAIAARGLIVHRLLHPVVCVERDEEGLLTSVEPFCEDKHRRESVMYLETDRTDARGRRDLVADLHRVLADVRAAVSDWQKLQDRMRGDAEALSDEEGAALLHWFADGAFTLLAYQVEHCGREPSGQLGLAALPGADLWDSQSCAAAIAYFENGGTAPLIAKADRISPVHRRVPLDLVILPVREGGQIAAIGVHAGLWTSQALRAPSEQVPVLRRRLDRLEQEFGFDPKGHAGKALRHAVASLPRDLLVSLRFDAVKELIATAMSLADRPRPIMLLLQSILKGHLFAFVWLPREELSTARRNAIGRMIEQAASGTISSWSVELGDGDLALIRYTLDVDMGSAMPDAAALDARLNMMVRGWEPSVEEALGAKVGPARATRLALGYVNAFPETYRARTLADDAAEDILRLAGLSREGARDARLYNGACDQPHQLRLKTYRLGSVIPLSDAVPVFENFGFRVLEEQPSALDEGRIGYIHDFLLEMQGGGDAGEVLARAASVEKAIAAVLEGEAENDVFNQLLVAAALDRRDVVLFRAWFRYLRQTGLSYSMQTVVDALRKAPAVTKGMIALFDALHDPRVSGDRVQAAGEAEAAITAGLASVAAIDDDRILRMFRSVVMATLRTNAFAAASREALAFKLDSSLIPGLPAPVPWREIWVYSPRVEGIHLRGGPVARGGLRWSDRRDDFRTEILGLMKAQVVKNAVIVPTGAKGGFYPKQLPPVSDRDAWFAEGTESYRIFIRSLLSVTDNIVEGKVVHPEGVTIRDDDDPYFVVAADKGTATFSDVANAISAAHHFWLGDAFASGGSQGYDHKAMGITAKGAWVSVQRHFAEMGVDVQTQSINVVGCGDMSGDVFGNGMLLSKAIKLVAAFDHRHIFLDPDPDPAKSWDERARMFQLPRSSWEDYDKALISKGGGVFARTLKSIPLTPEVKAALGIEADELTPADLISAILKSPADLIWFGGIGTYIKASTQNNAEVGDPGNDGLRVNASELRAKAVGEGANLGVTQAARIEFSARGGRINTDFIDNSAGVDCSDNEVNIKIPLNREMAEGRLAEADRNALLAAMTDAVAHLVLEDNRLQTLALSIAERGGAAALPAFVRAIEILEEAGRLNRKVEGLDTNENLLRRAQDNRGLTRPELAVLLSTSKMALQAAIERGNLAEDPTMEGDLMAAFPPLMQEKHPQAIREHRLRCEIIATKVANRFVNRMGILAPFALTEEEGASWAQAAAAFVAAERLFDMPRLWADIDTLAVPEAVRLALFDEAAKALRFHVSDIIRCTAPDALPGEMVAMLEPGLKKLDAAVNDLLRDEARGQAGALHERIAAPGVPADIVDRIVRLFEMNGGVGIAALGQRQGVDEVALTQAYTKLGEALGLDWAQSAANRFHATDQWERLLTAGLARDFEQLRLDFLERGGKDPHLAVDKWVSTHAARIEQFRHLVDRARTASVTTSAMLAQIATQARVLLAR
ncbi:NAD-glutamate dehydrogenase [Allosphingosinicella flava]|uniref:NAD-glutamate dehydrogenase n=1 Tax=Allosphingosinicella flava TaxID=2771430 RepID=A0A7T2GM19_9SPHN|nr:NAD-glutamate dehydrogenase domain-containing protein [Sphingosinicella flava]QPQ56345.1 NAD-glutamate dehydrogenase [Sphingosinicella flava]